MKSTICQQGGLANIAALEVARGHVHKHLMVWEEAYGRVMRPHNAMPFQFKISAAQSMPYVEPLQSGSVPDMALAVTVELSAAIRLNRL